MSVAENYKRVQLKVKEAAERRGGSPESVKIIAISKRHPNESIYQGIKAGITDFGENRVQEAIQKVEEIQEAVNWHFIGTLQKNKIKYIINKFCLIHSVDTLALAEALNNQAEKNNTSFNILMQLNISREEVKHGFEAENALQEAKKIMALKNLNLKGVMGMAPWLEDIEKTRPYFKELKDVSNVMNKAGIEAPEISMGMSGDYEIAIEEGSTMVRVGTAIFGTRQY
ncbi:MAG: YggS family pyridoxal phosphate-dependent enzyme [Nitrospinae bacterium]|nr:YggS family pyridoxal phosphate-dependent enzyme [Nitrospinota bacterium]